MHALATTALERLGTLRLGLIDALRFGTGMTIVGGVFVVVQTLLLAEHLCAFGAPLPARDRSTVRAATVRRGETAA